LRVQLLSNLALVDRSGSPLDLGSPTTRSLFAYLVLKRAETVDRRRLAFLLWPRGTDAAARRNLRQYLHRLRRALEPVDPRDTVILTEGNSIRFVLPAGWELDVEQFEEAIDSGQFARAVELYTGDLLQEVYEDWVEPERERLARLYRQTLLRLIDQHSATRSWPQAIGYALRYLDAEPLLEGAHFRLMWLYYATGNRAAVKEQYEALVELLASELGAEPLPETTAAYEAMMAGNYAGGLEMELAPATMAPTPGSESPPTMTSPPLPALTPPARRDVPFIGRQAELAWLDDALTASENGCGGIYFIEGESGVGKTRLVEQWLEGCRAGHYLFMGSGREFEAMLPYASIAEALRRAAGDQQIPWDLFRPPPAWLAALQPLLPDLYSQFPVLEEARGKVGGQHHVVEGLGHFFLTLAAHRPVILFLDNLHWGDLPTWNFLGYLAPRTPSAHLLVIITGRSEDTPPERLALLRTLARQGWLQQRSLSRLSREETRLLALQMLGEEKDTTTADLSQVIGQLYDETEGNPFFVIETIRALREAGIDWHNIPAGNPFGRKPTLPLPAKVQALIQSRLDKLPDDGRPALGMAAAIGREFTFEILEKVSGIDSVVLLDALDEWLARGLVRETRDGYDFTHEKVSQVAYEQLARARRQWIHGRIASFLEETAPETDPAKLAQHYYLSNEPGHALPYLVEAGQRALAIRSYDEAREFGMRAIGLLGRIPHPGGQRRAERVDLNLLLAQAYAFSGALPKALKLLQETEHLAEGLGDIERLAQIFQRSSQILWLRGRGAAAADYARRVLRHAEELGSDSLRLPALRMLGRTHILTSRYDDAIAYLLRYIDLTEGGLAPADLPIMFGYLGVAYARVGSSQRAIDAAQRGLDLANDELHGATHVVARMQLAFVYAELREWRQALAVVKPVRDVWREAGMSPHNFMLRAVVGRALVHLGKPAPGLAEIEAALEWARAVDHRLLVHIVILHLAQSQYTAGHYEEAMATAREAEQMAAASQDPWAEALAWRTQAEIAMRLPRPEWNEIEKLLIQARDLLRAIRTRPELARTYLSLRRLYDRAGQVAWAVDCHFRATSIFDELGLVGELKTAQGSPAGERTGAVVIPGLSLLGPNVQILSDPQPAGG